MGIRNKKFKIRNMEVVQRADAHYFLIPYYLFLIPYFLDLPYEK